MYTFFCRICGEFSLESAEPHETCDNCINFFSIRDGFILRTKKNEFVLLTGMNGERSTGLEFTDDPYTAHVFHTFNNAVSASRRVDKEVAIINVQHPTQRYREVNRRY